jgi:hypothetical protein
VNGIRFFVEDQKMKRQFLIIALGLGLILPYHVAAASGCTVKKYTHNDSLVDAKSCADKLTMTYTQPRPELVQSGARKGSMMFTGTEQTGGAISGHALTLDARCGAMAFAVTGSRQGSAIVLQGNMPVRDSNCQISRHEAYRMVFSPQASNPVVNKGTGSAPAVVTPSCPAGYVFSQGQCLSDVAPQSAGQSVNAPAAVSSAATAPAPAPAADVKQQLSRGELTIAIQRELERLGCNPGPADGDWGQRSRNAMIEFNRQANLSLNTAKPNEAALPVLRAATGKICSSPPVQLKSVKKRKVVPAKKVAQPAKKKSPSVSGQKKNLWGGEQTRLDCERAITADCF